MEDFAVQKMYDSSHGILEEAAVNLIKYREVCWIVFSGRGLYVNVL